MKLSDVIQLLDAKIIFGHERLLQAEVRTAAASDLMSDILARVDVPDILLTRLNNPQVMRTSAVFGIKAVIIVRSRPIDEKMVALAHEEQILLLSTPASLFESCGKLYAQGMRSASQAANSSQQ